LVRWPLVSRLYSITLHFIQQRWAFSVLPADGRCMYQNVSIKRLCATVTVQVSPASPALTHVFSMTTLKNTISDSDNRISAQLLRHTPHVVLFLSPTDYNESDYTPVADLGIDGRGSATGGMDPPPHRGSEAVLPAGVQGAEAPLGVWGRSPRKLKPKNTLEASQKALW